MRLQALDGDAGAPTLAPAEPARPAGRRGGDLIFLDTGADSSRPGGRPAGPVSRKTRAIIPDLPPAAAPETIPLVATGNEPEVSGPTAPAEPLPSLIDDSPLQIETASLADTPLELESLQPISDEALVELSGATEVAQAAGFESTELSGLDTVDVAPIDGLELDAPAPDSVELQISTEGLDLERASLDPEELEPARRSSLIVPEPVDVADEQDPIEIHVPDTAETPMDLLDLDVGVEAPPESEPEFVSLDLDPAAEGSDTLALIEGADAFALIEDEASEEARAPQEMPRLSDSVTFIDSGTVGGPSIADLEDRVLDDPDDPEAHRALGEALLAEGDQFRGQEELELALAGLRVPGGLAARHATSSTN